MKAHNFYRPPGKENVDSSLASLKPAMVRSRPDQVKNNAGGYVFGVTDEEQLRRFLILGASGTYYQSGDEVVLGNLKVLDKYLNSPDIVRFLVEMRPLVPSSKTLVASMAYIMKFGSDAVKRQMANRINSLLWTGDDLMRYLSFCKEMQRGWGRAQTRLVNNWFNMRQTDKLALLMLKYKGRYGWTMRDVMKLGSVAPTTQARDALYAYITARIRGGEERYDHAWKKVCDVRANASGSDLAALDILWDVEEMWEDFSTANVDGGISIAKKNNFPWELLPSELMNDWRPWEEYLLESMGPRAMLRNLNRLTKMGIADNQRMLKIVWDRMHDPTWVSGAHPASYAIALMQYSSGSGKLGSGSWEPVPYIVKAVDDAFAMSYSSHSLLGDDLDKSMIVGIDVSPSMSGSTIDSMSNMRAIDVAGLMAGIFIRGERPGAVIPLAFSSSGMGRHGMKRLNYDSSSSIIDIVRAVRKEGWNGGGTDCSMPFQWALDNNKKVDCVVIITDNETWAGKRPNEVLNVYRHTINPNVRFVAVACTPAGYSIADPGDELSMNVVGFDSSAPEIIEKFLRGEI